MKENKMKTDHQKNIEKFMTLAGQTIPDKPQLPPDNIRILRSKLILEEAIETINALGCTIRSDEYGGELEGVLDICLHPTLKPDLVEIADGCADVSVVTIGTLSACGISDQKLLEEVDNNNLMKFGPGSYKNADGKHMKPPNHPRPKIKEAIGL